ncbi:acyltransferase [Streptomyces sp. NPDC048483]|uniref:acyltransferase family protein n=1 Tax=Streptomyces sp. NPDC048483 TaxID=3154927 RepID=UPI0034363D39
MKSQARKDAPPDHGIGSGKLPSLTGLRFVAAAGVVFTHCMALIDPSITTSLAPPIWVGASSVSLFFILSGYVLTHSARPHDSAGSFWRRRAAKILPNHIVTWCAMMMALAASGVVNSKTAPEGIASLLLVHPWIPQQSFASGGNPVSWSLGVEMFFYLLFPVLRLWVERLTGRALLIGMATALAVVWACPLLCPLFTENPDALLFPGLWLLYYLPLARLPEFIVGMMLARMLSVGVRLPRIGLSVSSLAVVATIVVLGSYLPHRFMFAAATALPLVLLVKAAAESDLQGRRSVLRTPALVFLGEISYAMYLVHFIVLGLTDLCVSGIGGSKFQVVLAGVPLSVLVSWLLYARVERPCMRLLLTARNRMEPVA